MLTLLVEDDEIYDEETNTFIQGEGTILELEHSLLSLSKWESKYEKPFLGPDAKTPEEIKYYVEMMVISNNYSDEVFSRISKANIDQINDYISSSQSATTFNELQRRGGRPEVITSELIYFWMVSFRIPWEAQAWHLNRLFALIRVCNIKNSDKPKMSRNELAQRNRELNQSRREQLGSTG